MPSENTASFGLPQASVMDSLLLCSSNVPSVYWCLSVYQSHKNGDPRSGTSRVHVVTGTSVRIVTLLLRHQRARPPDILEPRGLATENTCFSISFSAAYVRRVSHTRHDICNSNYCTHQARNIYILVSSPPSKAHSIDFADSCVLVSGINAYLFSKLV